MPKLYLIPHALAEKTHVFLNVHNTDLAHELFRQLSTLPEIEIITSVSEADVIIYFAGFDPPSLTETLSHTSQLYTDLKSVNNHHTKFILVVKNSASHLSRTAITLTNQFALTYHLNHTIVEYDSMIPLTELASSIIKKFIYHHVPIVPPPPPVAPQAPPRVPAKKPNSKPKFIIRNMLYIILALASPWLVSFLLSLTVLTASLCLTKQPICLHTAKYSGFLLQRTARISPGFPALSNQFGLPLVQVQDVLDDAQSLGRISDQLKKDSALLLASLFSTKPAPSSSDLLVKAYEVDNLLNLLQADLRAVYLATPTHLRLFENLAKSAGESRHSLNTYLPAISQLLQNYASGKKTYAVFLSDNWELRGNGGLVEGFILVKADSGHIVHSQVYSTRSTDDQLSGSVTPPSDFQLTTHQTQWYLRDVTWETDLPTLLSKAAWFVEKELNEKVDGAIVLDLNTLSQLLRITGPIQVGESKINVTHANFLQVYESQLSNSQTYNSFLTSLFQSVFEHLHSLDQSGYAQLLDAVSSQIQSGQVFISDLPNLALGLPECRSFIDCQVDFAYPLSANVTGSKTNLYLTKEHTMEVTLNPSGQETRHSFTYLYSPPSNSWLPQNHQEYLRLFIPGPSITSLQVFLDGRQLPEESLQKISKPGLIGVGAAFTVNKNRPVKIEFHYQSTLPTSRQFHYQLDIPNQPGVVGDKVQIQINYPPAWGALVDEPASVAAAGLLEYNHVQPNWFQLNIDFTKP